MSASDSTPPEDAQTPPAAPVAPPSAPAPAGLAPHVWLVRTLIGIATVLGVVAIFAVWANRQLLDTHYWTNTSTKMLENGPIREQLSGYLTDQLYANVDVAGELRGELPSELKPLAAPAAGALRGLVEKGVNFALERPRVQALWRTANEAAHAQFVKLIEDRSEVVRLPGGGQVVIDLRPLLREAASRVGAPTSVVEKIPPNVAELHVVKSNNLRTAQSAVNLLRSLAIILPLLVYLLFGLAVYLARGRRRQTLISVGAAFIGAALAVLVVRGVAKHAVVNSLATTASVKPAIEAAYTIGTSVLSDIAWSTILAGIVIILAGLLAGPTRAATSVRRFLAPYLRERPDLSYGAGALLLALLFLWGPIVATRTFTGVIIITVLGFFGLYMLRRQTTLEFPNEQAHFPLRPTDR
ncbi:MAG TPA: hypothetical protein VIC06_12215 [Solirubrobacteraceae bacterium]